LNLLVSLPGLTGQSSAHGQCVPDRPVKPGDDTIRTKDEGGLIEIKADPGNLSQRWRRIGAMSAMAYRGATAPKFRARKNGVPTAAMGENRGRSE
jgi:hypothetical protein